jgi:hypothetical protein
VGNTFQLTTVKLGDHFNLCQNQRFRDQPMLGFGTGFLVVQNKIVTAGHCMKDFFDDVCVIFDFEGEGLQNEIRLERKKGDVYFVQKAEVVVDDPPLGRDFAVVTLDRNVNSDIVPLELCETPIKKDASVYTIGHPCGLPKKVAWGARVFDTSPKTHFVTNLDAFGGNSGSPVLNDAHQVCGILVRGKEDFVQVGDCYVAAEFPLNSAGEEVCPTSIWSSSIRIERGVQTSEISGKSAVPEPITISPPPSTFGTSKPPRPGPIRVPDDLQKNRWGGESSKDGRRLSAVLVDTQKKLFFFNIIVESTDGTPLVGPVVFHLHDTFPKPVIYVRKTDGGFAQIEEANAIGVFTIGAQVQRADGEWIGLEYDLSELPDLPDRFK